MAYSKRNLLIRIIEIQALVIAGHKKGITQKYVYENEVKPRFLISYSTFNNYLARNAKKELVDLDNKLKTK